MDVVELIQSQTLWGSSDDEKRAKFHDKARKGAAEALRALEFEKKLAIKKARKDAAAELKALEYEKELARQKAEQKAEEERLAALAAGPYTPKGKTAADVVKDICIHRGVGKDELLYGPRDKRIAPVRHEISYWLRLRFGFSYPRICYYIGLTDHTSAIHGVRKYAAKHGLELPK